MTVAVATRPRAIPRSQVNPKATGPQEGPQTAFLGTSADIAIYGGAAGGGKSWALLMEPLRHIHKPGFGSVIFRRTSVQVRNEGGLWDESFKIYGQTAATPRSGYLDWTFPGGGTISFAHLEHDKDTKDWQGSQITLIGFDELTHFTAYQFWYLVSRNRSMCGVKPYIRATCNPDADSWVAQFISWWINQDTGYAIPERAGVLRWFVRVGDKLIWADKPEELTDYIDGLTGEPIKPKSVTFIPSKLTDNKMLMAADPGYSANLQALPPVERERLLNGNWKIRNQGQTFFSIDSLMVGGQPVVMPTRCDGIYAVLDTAIKDGSKNDGTAVSYFATTKFVTNNAPLVICDWDITQIEGSLLELWLPSVFLRGEELAKACGARKGFLGVFIEDAASGQILLQQAKRKKWNVHAIDSKLTALGKDARAIAISGHVYNGKVKISAEAYWKVVTYKDVTRNHFTHQVENYVIGDPDAAKRADDLFDTFTYGVSLGLGDRYGA